MLVEAILPQIKVRVKFKGEEDSIPIGQTSLLPQEEVFQPIWRRLRVVLAPANRAVLWVSVETLLADLFDRSITRWLPKHNQKDHGLNFSKVGAGACVSQDQHPKQEAPSVPGKRESGHVKCSNFRNKVKGYFRPAKVYQSIQLGVILSMLSR